MSTTLSLTVGRASEAGHAGENRDFDGALLPAPPLLLTKGAAIALADGIGSSPFGRVAAETAVKSFLDDYYCTSEAATVATSAMQVLRATNSWLHARTRGGPGPHERDHGHVATFDALVFRSRTLHLFHVGDARVFRLAGRSLEPLTEDHRVRLDDGETRLARALGADPEVVIDRRSLPVDRDDVFVLATDGVWEHVAPGFVADAIADASIAESDLDAAARAIVAEAAARGSRDDRTVVIVRVDAVGAGEAAEVLGDALHLPPAPPLAPGTVFEGHRILRVLHESHRSRVHLAVDLATDRRVVLKTPSTEAAADPELLQRFAMEEWIARRIASPHVVEAYPPTRRRDHLYVALEWIDGVTLAQWMTDHPEPDLDTVRDVVGQIAEGLRAFHRREMLHQDLRPENVMIDRHGVVKIVDFGSTRVAGVVESDPTARAEPILGTFQYTAPEYFLGEAGTPRSDLYSLGVIAYRMLTGELPYGAAAARIRTPADRRRLRYRSARDPDGRVPIWVDAALARAVDPDPRRRPEALSEFVFDLHHPSARDLAAARRPLAERDPVLFWKGVSALLAAALLIVLFGRRFGGF